MTTNLSRLARSLDAGAPDMTVAETMKQERDKIEESLRTVGEYVLSDDHGRIYVITSDSKSDSTKDDKK
jgi:hypothetical protein